MVRANTGAAAVWRDVFRGSGHALVMRYAGDKVALKAFEETGATQAKKSNAHENRQTFSDDEMNAQW